MARKLSASGEAYLRRNLGDTSNTDRLIHDINIWEPKPPRSLAVTGVVPKLTEKAKAYMRRMLGADAEEHIIAIDAWADQANIRRSKRQKSLLWTPERLGTADRTNAERQRRFRERKRAAKQALKATSAVAT